MSVVDPEIIKQVALLARLRLDPDALNVFSAQIDEILEYVRQLQAVSTEGVEPTSHVLPLANVLRKDEPQPSLTQEAVIRMAPDAQAPFVKIPKVIEGA